MEDFQLQEDLINTIYLHAKEEAPRECCGLVVDNGEYIKVKNIAENEEDFKMDEKTFALLQLQRKILYVVHSHYNSNCKPSEYDKVMCKAMDIPYLIMSYPKKDYYILKP
jgi:proteasome lid subunit RPN8/RPN11